MSTTAELAYTFSQPYPDILQAGRICKVEMRVSRSGSLVEPSAGTFTLLSPDGTEMVSAASVTIIGSVATYSIPAAALTLTTAHVSLGGGWQEVWTLTLPDGTTRTVDRPASLARRPINPPVSDANLTSHYPQLPGLRGTAENSGQSHLDNAWGEILRRWERESGKTYLVKSVDQFYDVMLNLALAKQFQMLAVYRKDSTYKELGDGFQAKYETQWGRIVTLLDDDHDGKADDPDAMLRRSVVINPGGGTPTYVGYGGTYWGGRGF